MPYYSIEYHGKATVWAENEQQRMRTPMTRPALAQMKNFISIM